MKKMLSWFLVCLLLIICMIPFIVGIYLMAYVNVWFGLILLIYPLVYLFVRFYDDVR